MAFSCASALQVERVDDGFLVLRPGSSQVFHLRGGDAEAFALARRGGTEVPEHLERSMAGLVELDLAEADGWSRRRVLQLGGAAAAAAVAVVALPSVAAA